MINYRVLGYVFVVAGSGTYCAAGSGRFVGDGLNAGGVVGTFCHQLVVLAVSMTTCSLYL